MERCPRESRLLCALPAPPPVRTIIGQYALGVLADLYGRRKMYGLELLVIIITTVGVTMASEGASQSMNLAGWLIFWRFLMGIGIGADYPLSAVIVSEFVPTKSRARMIATVFVMQQC
ncbi:MFS transporter, PHS family, inorganic phosphate transporter [Blastomyces gilchristii SLH14081]|uniref:MFS transporter, PHS family, inorganic phosphate transporter n=1 Tax=Blastomyces gilchristii (strain SLH14081) TaxID=559298 RepID=A0A179UMW6_BLAGS|nr:MFS transporter, PHS family, inorganic phosphate transporter [Blastomyces gilchristii SLH14081]OAT09314.1 MFS transporter, PHS family, inorganic phosphate transporter [Blastomyces gilchristii SLH14081]